MLEVTHWSLFVNTVENTTQLADSVCSYINFCVHLVIPMKTIRIYPNIKPWITCEIKEAINKKKLAFKSENKEQMVSAQKELKTIIKKGKHAYKNNIEKYFDSNNMKRVWEGMNLMGGCKKKGNSSLEGDKKYANDLNEFYARIDHHDFKSEINDRFNFLSGKIWREEEAEKIQLTENEVLCNLKKMKVGKPLAPILYFPVSLWTVQTSYARSFVIFLICHRKRVRCQMFGKSQAKI